jgi:hypothetical protein
LIKFEFIVTSVETGFVNGDRCRKQILMKMIRVVYIDYLCNIRYLVSMEDDDSIQCPVCNGEGFDLDGFVCWKCKGDGQITHSSTSKDSTDTNINKFTL